MPKDDPLMIAWEAYKATEDYANTLKWAPRPEHTEGSLWAAFLQGWSISRMTTPDRGSSRTTPRDAERAADRQPEAIALWLHVATARLRGPEYLDHSAREHIAELVGKAVRFLESTFPACPPHDPAQATGAATHRRELGAAGAGGHTSTEEGVA